MSIVNPAQLTILHEHECADVLTVVGCVQACIRSRSRHPSRSDEVIKTDDSEVAVACNIYVLSGAYKHTIRCWTVLNLYLPSIRQPLSCRIRQSSRDNC